MLIDRRDRRPILLANARIMDPSRDLDFPGDVLIADGVIREAKRGIGAAGVPEGTEVVECQADTESLESVYATAGELIAGGDLDTVLSRVTERAATAVRAPRYLLAVRVPGETGLRCQKS